MLTNSENSNFDIIDQRQAALDSVAKVRLIEGAPGVGKTYFGCQLAQNELRIDVAELLGLRRGNAQHYQQQGQNGGNAENELVHAAGEVVAAARPPMALPNLLANDEVRKAYLGG